MDKQAILRLFLGQGTQVDKNALDILSENPDILENILKIGKNKLPPVVTSEFLRSLYPTINKSKTQSEKLSVNQISQTVNYRYNFLRNLLSSKEELVNLVSINKINENLKQFSIIGIVSGLDEMLTIEDTTGEARFRIDRELSKYIVEDEVVGIVCERHGDTDIKQVVYPDIPLKKENNKTKRLEKCLFISDIRMDSPEFNTKYYKNFLNWLDNQKNLKVFILGGVTSRNEDIQKLLADIPQQAYFYSEEDIGKAPNIIETESIRILLAHGTFLQWYIDLWKTEPETTIINLLRKRNLNPRLTNEFYNNSFLLETVPDIIVVSGINKATSTNYKGITILTNGSFDTKPVYWLINLQTRETFKIDFS